MCLTAALIVRRLVGGQAAAGTSRIARNQLHIVAFRSKLRRHTALRQDLGLSSQAACRAVIMLKETLRRSIRKGSLTLIEPNGRVTTFGERGADQEMSRSA